MRKIILTLTILLSFIINAQNPVGAWERIHTSKNGKQLKSVVIFSESHQSISIYESKTGKLLRTITLPAAAFATPSTYSVDGKQYIVIACGGTKLGTPKGNKYVAFSL